MVDAAIVNSVQVSIFGLLERPPKPCGFLKDLREKNIQTKDGDAMLWQSSVLMCVAFTPDHYLASCKIMAYRELSCRLM